MSEHPDLLVRTLLERIRIVAAREMPGGDIEEVLAPAAEALIAAHWRKDLNRIDRRKLAKSVRSGIVDEVILEQVLGALEDLP